MTSWSRRTISVLFLLSFCLCLPLVAQNSTAKATPETQTTTQPNLKPQLTVGDLVFTLNTLASVNINGSEVEAYLDVKTTLVHAYEQAQKDKKQENDIITVEMSVLTANNFWQLFQRANIQGSAAERYMAVKNALYASAPKNPVSGQATQPVQGTTGQK